MCLSFHYIVCPKHVHSHKLCLSYAEDVYKNPRKSSLVSNTVVNFNQIWNISQISASLPSKKFYSHSLCGSQVVRCRRLMKTWIS